MKSTRTYRFMRLIVMFDLPMTSSAQRRSYTRFKKALTGLGFLMMQQSVYCKLCLNGSSAETYKRRVREIKPEEGIVQMFVLSERQYHNIEVVIGKTSTDVLHSDERLIVL